VWGERERNCVMYLVFTNKKNPMLPLISNLIYIQYQNEIVFVPIRNMDANLFLTNPS
jgi:hypothetical protein